MKLKFVFLSLAIMTAGASEDVTVYRDTYGVPHVYAASPAGGAYALGYVQAEDRLKDLYDNIRIALGAMAEAYGPEHVEQDYFMHVIQNAEKCEQYWKSAPELQKDLCIRFLQGVQTYLAEHPEAKPETAFELQPWHLMAIGRAMIMRWPLGNIMDDLGNKHKNPGIGSNGWAVSSSRTAAGGAILLADPHLEWEGMSVFYQATVHAGDMHMEGFFLVGSPLVGIGHNGNVAWACTTGGPDTGDVYALKINPKNPLQYEVDGAWKDAELKMITINVKGRDPVTRPALFTQYGPAVEEPDMEKGILYVGSTPYFDVLETFEQSYRMVMAKNCEEFYHALEVNALMDQNIPFADRGGNIQYVRVGRTPIRPEGYDWTGPVPGGIAASQYKGVHPLSAHVQVKNPPQGYFQNCNISPENMMVGSPMTADKYPKELFNVTWDTSNPRGRRITALLDADSSITRAEAMAYATDVYDLLAMPWQKALWDAVSTHGVERMKDPDFAAVVEDILEWRGEFVKSSTATPILKLWRLKCKDEVDFNAVAAKQDLPAEQQQKLLDLLGESIQEMKATYGMVQVPWGDAYVIGRGDTYYPSDGADFGATVEGPNFTETLFDVRYKDLEGAPGKYVGCNGTGALILTFLREDGVEAYTCTPWGVSADPASPHYMDQGRDFYSPRKLKPTWFDKEDLMAHVESEKTLLVP